MSERLTDEQLRQIARSFTDQSIEAAAVKEALALRARNAKLEAALMGLVLRIDEIANDPDFRTMQSVFFTHGFRYGGPSWAGPLKDAHDVLAEP